MAAADYLAQIEARANAATEGPWATWAGLRPDGVTRYDSVGAESDPEVEVCETPLTPQGREDAEFIAHARADVPALVAALRAVLALHKPGVGASQGYLPGGDYGYIEPYCEGCVHSDEYAQHWPCQTARAVATALGVNPS